MGHKLTLASTVVAGLLMVGAGIAQANNQEFLVKVRSEKSESFTRSLQQLGAANVEDVGFAGWKVIRINSTDKSMSMSLGMLKSLPGVVEAQRNFTYSINRGALVKDPAVREEILNAVHSGNVSMFGAGRPFMDEPPADNPEIPGPKQDADTGSDPLVNEQWGMNDIGAVQAHQAAKNGETVLVAVIDTGVDYTHEDLLPNLWRNSGEYGTDSSGADKSKNGVDDDKNGYVDDLVGWDFATDDNKPYDFMVSPMNLVMGGGNPGHGTHCAGNVGAVTRNSKGIVGVAGSNVKIMGLRFLTEKGQGETAGAIKAIKYAVDNGAKVLSNSWGGTVEEGAAATDEDKALREVIEYAMNKGVLFVAAAGNGDQTGTGYDIDKSGMIYPGGLDTANIVTVAALDKNDQLGKFSNWGPTSVDIGAPGVSVFSTVPKYGYEVTLMDLSSFGMGKVDWDGTSMATPHVAGAAALYWSANPKATWQEVKEALLQRGKTLSVLQGKTVSGRKLNAASLMGL